VKAIAAAIADHAKALRELTAAVREYVELEREKRAPKVVEMPKNAKATDHGRAIATAHLRRMGKLR